MDANTVQLLAAIEDDGEFSNNSGGGADGAPNTLQYSAVLCSAAQHHALACDARLSASPKQQSWKYIFHILK